MMETWNQPRGNIYNMNIVKSYKSVFRELAVNIYGHVTEITYKSIP